jgi:hypothetical protein
MTNKNEPAGEVYVSANPSIKIDVINHPIIIEQLKDPKCDLHEAKIVHVLPYEIPPQESGLIITHVAGKKVVVKDINGMTGEAGRYYKKS